MSTTTEELPITKMLEERKKLLEFTSRQTACEGLDFRQSISEIEQALPQVRQMEQEQLSKARKEERDRIVGILNNFSDE